MRGGDRVVQECSWMSGIRFDFHHSTYYCRNLSFRHPSSASLAGSEVPSSLAASPRGKPRTQKPLDITIQRSALLRELREATSLPYGLKKIRCIPFSGIHPSGQKPPPNGLSIRRGVLNPLNSKTDSNCECTWRRTPPSALPASESLPCWKTAPSGTGSLW